MAQQQFRVSNAAGMWLRTAPIVSEVTKKVLLPQGQLVTKLGDTDKPNWWHVSTIFQGDNLEGFSNKTLMVADTEFDSSPVSGSMSGLIAKTFAALDHVAPRQPRPGDCAGTRSKASTARME